MRFTRLLVAGACLLPAVAGAQTVRGVVVDQADAPVPGVLLQMLDSSSHVVARALTNERGEYRIAAPRAGTYRIATLRIGYRPTTLEPQRLPLGGEIERRLVLTGVRLALDTVRVAGTSVCRGFTDSAAATYAVWEQVRAALVATQLTAGSRTINVSTVDYEKTMDRDMRRVEQQATTNRSEYVKQPWRTVPPDSLHRAGYVIAEQDWVSYYAPGLDMLVSDAFVEDHCFRLAIDKGRFGLAFEPAQDRRRTPEIRGTMWLDQASSKLRSLEYKYVHLEPEQEDRAGGEMEFVTMRDGSWAVSHWNIRMPVLERAVRSQSMGGDQVRVSAVRVTGGDLVLARRGNDTLWIRPAATVAGESASTLAALAGVVTDTAKQPIAGAEVSLSDIGKAVLTDERGAFRLVDIAPGAHRMAVRRVGFGPADAQIDFGAGKAVMRQVVLTRVTTLDSVVTTATPLLPSFEENRKLGLGHFLTRDDLARQEGGRLAAALHALPGIGVIDGRGGHAWVIHAGTPPSMCRGAIGMTQTPNGLQLTIDTTCVKREGKIYLPEPSEVYQGIMAQCYAHVFLNDHLMNPGRPATPFDVNSIAVGSLEAVEYYATPAQTPMKYSNTGAECGVLVLWSRRSP